jgi:hypothetical protein
MATTVVNKDGTSYLVEELTIEGFEIFQHTPVLDIKSPSKVKLSPLAKPFSPICDIILPSVTSSSSMKEGKVKSRWDPNAPSSDQPTQVCKLSDLTPEVLAIYRPSRGGIIPCVPIQGQRYHCYGFDWKTGEVTDLAGGISYGRRKTSSRYRKFGPSANDALHGCLMEFMDESLNIFKGGAFGNSPLKPPSTSSVSSPLKSDETSSMQQIMNLCQQTDELTNDGGFKGRAISSPLVLWNPKMMNIIVPMEGVCPIRKISEFNAALQEKIRKNGKHEISGLCWLPESVVLARINGVSVPECDLHFYSKVAIFLRGGLYSGSPTSSVPKALWWNSRAHNAPSESFVKSIGHTKLVAVEDEKTSRIVTVVG